MNKTHRNIHSKGRLSRKLVSALSALALVIGLLAVPDCEAKAAKLSLSVNKSTVKIDDKVTVTITVPAGVSATVNLVYPGDLLTYVSASETCNANNSTVIMTLGGYGGTDTATSGTVKFKAIKAGTASFTVTAPVAGNQEGDMISLDSATAKLEIENETVEDDPPAVNPGGNENNEGGQTIRKSADNSLSSLVLSAGTLMPEFKYNVVRYTAIVDNSVTSVVVSAKTSNAKATIESVTGGDDLKVGENKIQIQVKAENGVVATYTITVIRREVGASEDTPGTDPNADPGEETEPEGLSFVINGSKLYPIMTIPEEIVPDGFEASELTIDQEVYSCLEDSFANGRLCLLYLAKEEGGSGELYLSVDRNLDEICDFVSLRSEKGFVVALPDGSAVPNGYQKKSVELAGKGSIYAWFAEDESSFALFYGINQSGKEGWYMLDTDELTYMRYTEPAKEVVQEPDTTGEEKPTEPKKDSDELRRMERINILIIGIAAIVVIILLIIIGILALHRHKPAEEETDDDLELIDL